jgi:hypothetical protein
MKSVWLAVGRLYTIRVERGPEIRGAVLQLAGYSFKVQSFMARRGLAESKNDGKQALNVCRPRETV